MVKGLNLNKTHGQGNLLWASLTPCEQDSAADLHHPNSLRKEYSWILGLFWVRGVLLLLQMHAGFQLFAFLFGNGVGSLLPAYLCHHKGWKLLSSMFSVCLFFGFGFWFWFFFNRRHHCHLLTALKEMGLWENHQIRPDSGSRSCWRTCPFPKALGVFRFALAWCITENYSSPSSKTVPDGTEFITWIKKRKEQKPCLFPGKEWRWRNIQGSSQEKTL